MRRTVRILNIIGFFIMIGFNIAANAIPLNGVTVGEISDRYPTLFTPAGITFAIWGVIYFTIFLFIIYQSTKGAGKEVVRIGILFFVTTLLNSAWIVAWNYEMIPLSLIIMIILFFTLMAVYIKINKDRYGSSLFFVRIPFSIYFAWICVALTANTAIFLKYIKWDMFGISEDIWLIFILAVVLLISSAVVLVKKDIAFSLVIIWAVLGIMMRHISELERKYPVAIALMTAICVVLVIENIFNLYKAMTK